MSVMSKTQENDARKYKMREYSNKFNFDFAREVFEVNKTNGFHDTIHSFEYLRVFIASELMEILDAHRKGIRARVDEFNRQYEFDWTENYRDYIKGTVEEEMADVVLRYLDLIAWMYNGRNEPKFSLLSDYVIDVPDRIDDSYIPLFIDRIITALYSDKMRISVVIYSIIQLSIILDIDLIYFVELKLEYNKTRGHLHGNKY